MGFGAVTLGHWDGCEVEPWQMLHDNPWCLHDTLRDRKSAAMVCCGHTGLYKGPKGGDSGLTESLTPCVLYQHAAPKVGVTV